MAARIAIQGGGIAALGCQHLLRRAGFEVARTATAGLGIPAILLSDAALYLIRDVFDRPDLFRDAPQITRRIVAWKAGEPAVALEHAAVVVSEQTLTGWMAAETTKNNTGSPGWSVCSARPLPATAETLHFGNRHAHASVVKLRPGTDSQACWIEALERGWLFLIPKSIGLGWLLAIGGTSESLLGESRVIAPRIEGTVHSAGSFPAHPRILAPLCGPGWIACGTAAIAFDPICGDGTANALREAILASACIQAIERGEDAMHVLQHYETRLVEGFQKHLVMCRDFYTSGRRGPWWEEQLTALGEGFDWCAKHLAKRPPYRYSLRDFELVR